MQGMLARVGVALGALLMLPVLATGCGEEGSATGETVPAGAVATVGGERVTQAEFDRALVTATKQEQRDAALIAPRVTPDPPLYARCIAAMRKSGNNFADVTLKAMCKEDYVRLRDQVMSQLLQAAQLEKLAKDRGLVVTQTEIDTALANQLKQTGLSQDALRKRLARVGATREDLVSSVRIQLLSAKIARDFGANQASLQAVQEQLKEETTCRQGFIFPAACGNAPE